MIKVIHILGAAGSGTTTLGREIESIYNFTHLDVDDYFWLPTNPPFTTKRAIEERIELLKKDILNTDKCVVTGSLCKWGDSLIPYFDLVIEIETPTDVRIERIKKREYKRFGSRILENGDMFQGHQDFLEWAKGYDTGDVNTRSKALHDLWLKRIGCKKVTIDGTKPLEETIRLLNKIIK